MLGPSIPISIFLILVDCASSSHVVPTAQSEHSAPPAYYVQGYDTNSYQVAPASRTSIKPVRPFRVVSTPTVAVIYSLLAWRAATIRDLLRLNLQGPTLYSRFANTLVIANVASCFIVASRAQAHKRMLKLVLGIDFFLEVILLDVSIVLHLFRKNKNLAFLPSGISSFWHLLIITSVLRSNWISSLPDPTNTSTESQEATTTNHHQPHAAENSAANYLSPSESPYQQQGAGLSQYQQPVDSGRSTQPPPLAFGAPSSSSSGSGRPAFFLN